MSFSIAIKIKERRILTDLVPGQLVYINILTKSSFSQAYMTAPFTKQYTLMCGNYIKQGEEITFLKIHFNKNRAKKNNLYCYKMIFRRSKGKISRTSWVTLDYLENMVMCKDERGNYFFLK